MEERRAGETRPLPHDLAITPPTAEASVLDGVAAVGAAHGVFDEAVAFDPAMLLRPPELRPDRRAEPVGQVEERRGVAAHERAGQGEGGAAGVGEDAGPIMTASFYPRACGGTTTRAMVTPINLGLSPRVRGNHRHGQRRGAGGRSTPARTGEPPEIGQRIWDATVYPRAYGGTLGAGDAADPVLGLPPRVRGNRQQGRLQPRPQGSTPARTGEPGLRSSTGAAIAVYPRAYGGTRRRKAWITPVQGLPPRVRGNHVHV